MPAEAISPLRRRLIEDMTIRQFSDKTKKDYIRQVKNFTVFLGRSPDQASNEDVRHYQVHLTAHGISSPSMHAVVSALKFFFNKTLGRHDIGDFIPCPREVRRLPVVLSMEEVARLLAAAPGIKAQAALTVAYAAGLRAGEVVALKLTDINSKRMVIRVEQGKGHKDRYVMLPEPLLVLLRAWWIEVAIAGVAVPRTEPDQPAHRAPAQPAVPHGGGGGGARQPCQPAHAAPQLRHPSLGAGRRHSYHPGPARTQEHQHHDHLHPGRHAHHPRGHEPAGASHRSHAEAQATDLTRHRSCRVQRWRSRTSSATTGPLGVAPTPVTSALAR